jgi:hypothetical protein
VALAPNITISNAVTYTAFVIATALGVFDNQFSTITGASNVTGSKYTANLNGVINTGTGNTSYLPGSTAGTTATGGQYG